MRTLRKTSKDFRLVAVATFIAVIANVTLCAEESTRVLNVPPEGFTALFNGLDLVDRRMNEITPEQRARVGHLWKEKEETVPEMPNRGHSFVKILASVAGGETRLEEDGKVKGQSFIKTEKVNLPPLAPAEHNNWPQFGGPNGNGVCDSARPPRIWSEGSNIVWKTPIHDLGWSSPVIWGDQIWVTTATPAVTADHRLRNKDGGLIPRAPTRAKSFFAVCVDRESGAVMHDVRVFDIAAPDTIAPENSYASPTPVIEEGRVYVHYGTYGTACLDTKTGEILWTRRDLNCDHEMGPGASPILHGDHLIFTVDGCDVQYVIALDKRTGKTAWKTDRTIDLSDFPYGRRKGYGTPTVYRAGGRVEMITTAALGLYGHDPQSGAELWKLKIRGNSMVPRPVCHEGILYVVIDHESPEICAIKPGGSGELDDSAIVWSVRKSAPRTPSFLLVDGTILWVTDIGIAVCADAKSGEVIWRQRVGGNYSASLISAGGRVYFFNQDATATVIELGRNYKQLATNRLDGEMHASPAVSGNSLFVRTNTHLYRIEE